MFAYCGNNPVKRVDVEGYFWETVWDIVSLGFSVAEVIQNPDDPMAWVGLAGDVIDVAVPFVGGIGETTRAVNVTMDMVDAVDDIHDTSKAVDFAQVATKGTPNEIGKMGEQLAGINPAAKVPIEVNGRTRIPDALTDTTLIEVKNVAYISNTRQLRDFATYANATGRSLELYVRPTTRVANTVKNAGWNINYLW